MNNETNQVAKSLTPKMIDALMFQVSRHALRLADAAIVPLYFAHTATRIACIKRGLVVLHTDGWRFTLTSLGYAVLDDLGLLSFYEDWASQIEVDNVANPATKSVYVDGYNVQFNIPAPQPVVTLVRAIETERIYKRLLSLWRKKAHLQNSEPYSPVDNPLVYRIICAELEMIMLEIDDLTLRFPDVALKVLKTQLAQVHPDKYLSEDWVRRWDYRLARKWHNFQWSLLVGSQVEWLP